MGVLELIGNLRDEMPKGLPFHLTDYMKLLDCMFLCMGYFEWVSLFSVFVLLSDSIL
jgi:hypothetical protein